LQTEAAVLSITRKKLLALVYLFLSPSLLLAQGIQPSSPKYVPGHVLVKFRATAQPAAIQAAHASAVGSVVKSFTSVGNLQLVKISTTTRLTTALAAYRANPDVLYAEPDYIVHTFQTPNDPLFPSMWSLLNTGQSGGTIGADIKATQAWNITTGSSSVIVAVIDTGVDYNHPDLAANIFNGPICPGGVVCHGINTIGPGGALGPNDPFDDNGHGTHVSGTIGALGNNAVGVTGINWNVTILPCKFLGPDGSGAVSGAIQCLDFIKALKDSGLNIVASNNSWGGGDFSQALQDAIDRQRQSGILFIAAAGNDFSENDDVPSYPASYPLPNIISVAATDRNDQRAFFSNIGQHSVHLGAPGQDILSTLPGASYGLDSGTSMATPHVTGVAALLAAQDPTRDWRAIKNLIVAGGDLNAEMAETISGRRLNAFGSLTCTNSVVARRLTPATQIVSGSVGSPIALSALNINCGQPNGPVQVTVSPGGQAIALTDDGVAPDLSAGDGVYTGSFIPAATGVYTLTFSTGDSLTVQVLNNYQATNTAFSYRTITGTNLNLGDDEATQIASPFPIAFGNGSFTQLWVSSNGTISFSGAFPTYLPEFIPTTNPADPTPPAVAASTLVAPFWDDLYPVKGTAQNIFWAVTGSAPNRELVVEWRDVKAFACNTEPDTITFQVVFFENSSNVLFNYSDAAFGGSCANHDRGQSGSIGMQVAPQVGTQWSFQGQSVNDGTALLWQVSTTPPSTPVTPVITSISPAVVTALGPDFTLTVNGSNFLPGARAKVTGGFDRVTTFVSSTQLSVLIPASDIDLFQTFINQFSIGVHNPGSDPLDSSLTIATLTVANPPNPVISSVTPAVASGDGLGFIININGSNFTPFTTVTWNGAQLQFPGVTSSNNIVVEVPGGLTSLQGTAQIQVTNPAPGGGSSAPFSYTIGPPTAGVVGIPGKFQLVPQPASNRQSTPVNLNPMSLPVRFMGWNNARQKGGQFLQHFIRPYGSLFAASASEKALSLSQANAAALPIAPSALPGLALNDSTLAGFLPSSVAVGDFNRDGHLDYAISNGGSNDIWIYFGNGDGTFQLPRIITLAGQSPLQILAADLRGTGILDLIVAEADSLSVGVLLGNGDGTFNPETLYFAPGPVLSIGVADFRSTGHLDVVAGIAGGNTTGPLSLFPGDGTGRLLPPIFAPTNVLFDPPWFTAQIAVADFDKDGLPDLAVTDEGQFTPGVIIYKNMGDGTFKQQTQILFSSDSNFLFNAVTGDINNDGCPDVVGVDVIGLADVVLGNCDGTFRPGPAPFQFGNGDEMANVTLADVNGDGNLDVIGSGAPLILSGAFGGQSGTLVSVALGDGTGALLPPRLYRGQTGMFGLATGDFNGDGHPDIVVASQDTDSTSVLLNDGTGGFPGPQGSYVGWAQKGAPFAGVLNAPFTQFVGDLNGDGRPDLFYVDFAQIGTLPLNISVALNDGTGHFAPDIKSPILDGAFQFGSLVTGDFRNLGKQDLVVIPSQFGETLSGHFYNFVPNNGDGHFGLPVTHNISHLPGTLAAGDFNGDGKLDFVMVGFSEIDTFLGNGDGTFTVGPTIPFATFPPNKVYVADLNGDGKLDLLVPVADGAPSALVEFLGNGDGSFAPGKTVVVDVGSGSGFGDPYFGIADLNHDGHLDVVVRNPSFFAPLTPVFKVYMGQPDGTFVLTNTYTPYSGTNVTNASFGFTNSFVADFNGDGNADIAAFQSDPVTGTYVQIMLGNGDGTFTPTFEKFPLGTSNAVFTAVVPDLNGDGKADFAELDQFTASYNVIHSGTGHPFQIQFASLPVVGSNAVIHATLPVPAAQSTTLQLSSSDPAITVPGSVTIPAGSLGADVNVTIGPAFNNSHAFSITGSDGVTAAKAVASVATPGAAVGLLTDFVSPPFRAILPGQVPDDFGYAVQSRGGYQTTVSLHCENLPPGVACQFGSTSLEVPAGGFNGTSLLLTIANPLPIGTYTFNVITQDAAISQSLPATFQVGDFGIQFDSAGSSALPSGSESFQVDISSINNYQGGVNLDCSGLPAGATCIDEQAAVGIGPTVGTPILVQTLNVPVGNYPFVINGSTGLTTHSVNAILHVGDFGATTITPTSATLAVGQSATFNLTVNSVNGFVDQLSLFCQATIPGQSTGAVQCTFSPANPTFDASGTLTDQITVTAVSIPRSTHVPTVGSAGLSRWVPPVTTALLLAAVFVVGPKKRRRGAILSCVCLLAISTIIACGGGGGAGIGTPGPAPIPTPTPQQPQTVTVTVFGESRAQSQSTIKLLGTLNVTVQ
jgi:subtilisin family serine protease